MSKDTDPEYIDQLNMDLGQLMNDVGRFSTNPEISKACQQLLVAASQIIILRHEQNLTKDDLKYIEGALTWSDKARNILADLAVKLHEGT